MKVLLNFVLYFLAHTFSLPCFYVVTQIADVLVVCVILNFLSVQC